MTGPLSYIRYLKLHLYCSMHISVLSSWFNFTSARQFLLSFIKQCECLYDMSLKRINEITCSYICIEPFTGVKENVVFVVRLVTPRVGTGWPLTSTDTI